MLLEADKLRFLDKGDKPKITMSYDAERNVYGIKFDGKSRTAKRHSYLFSLD